MGRSMKRPNALGGLLLLSAACVGTSTGNPLDDGHGEPGPGGEEPGPREPGLGGEESAGGNCREVGVREVGEDEQTSLGFTGRELLALAAAQRQETLRWHPSAIAEYGPERGEQPLTIAITRTAAPLRVVDYEQKQEGFEIGGDCPDLLEVEVDVSLQTAQGALNEQFKTKLTARSKELARISHRLDPKMLGGSFAITALRLEPGYELASLHVGMSITRFGVTGVLSPSFERRTAESVGQAASMELATWGAAACSGGGIGVPLDAQVGAFSAQQVFALLNQHDAQVAWHDGTSSALTLTFEPGANGVCAVLEGSRFALEGVPGTLLFTGTLRAESADARIAAAWPVEVVARPDQSGVLQQISVQLDNRTNRNGWTLADYGLHGFDVSSYDWFGVGVLVQVSPTGAWSGEVKVTGYERPDCPPPPAADPNGGGASSPGCPGSTPHEVARATLSSPTP